MQKSSLPCVLVQQDSGAHHVARVVGSKPLHGQIPKGLLRVHRTACAAWATRKQAEQGRVKSTLRGFSLLRVKCTAAFLHLS